MKTIYKCSKCGKKSEIEATHLNRSVETVLIKVSPCKYCMESKYTEGYDKGLEQISDDLHM